ncbi:MAG: Lrp/AsnC family transcriptional regulator [Candidatus Neomarinimicrobiota bacterium]|jgi:Lrp/AsnC family leucine-responsive transcriptional regulator|nr:Lrp/AsnC family transcriptional regulator [Candidatus Neomarinimicrobiota bacterium]|tara:strand:+ start:157 stop:618 length:462 start_codon:yes stop_codon:yes gene_type:complete
MKLDHIDKKILMELQLDGRATASHIGERVDLSVPAAAERIKKLQESGVIKGFRAVIDANTLGLDVSAIITVVSDSSKYYEKVIFEANKMPEVVRCFTTTGEGSHILLVQTKNTKSLETLLRKIQSWPGVIRTNTQLILSSYKDLSPIYFENEN